jgi:hypothetical protein
MTSAQHNIDDVVGKYVALREEKRKLEKAHEAELKPFSDKLNKLEAYLLARMIEDGVDQYKTANGTAYKSTKASCTIADHGMYKRFIFEPVAHALKGVLGAMGVSTDFSDNILEIILQSARWSMVDFRALKKGVEEYIDDNEEAPLGLNVTRSTSVNVRSK